MGLRSFMFIFVFRQDSTWLSRCCLLWVFFSELEKVSQHHQASGRAFSTTMTELRISYLFRLYTNGNLRGIICRPFPIPAPSLNLSPFSTPLFLSIPLFPSCPPLYPFPPVLTLFLPPIFPLLFPIPFLTLFLLSFLLYPITIPYPSLLPLFYSAFLRSILLLIPDTILYLSFLLLPYPLSFPHPSLLPLSFPSSFSFILLSGLLQQPQLDLAEALHEEQRQAMAERAAELRLEPWQ